MTKANGRNATLTPKQKKFANEYLKDLNATQAAIRAGYSVKTAYRTGADNLKKPQIQGYISERMKDRETRTEITQDRVLEQLSRIAFADIKDMLSFRTAKVVVGRDEEADEPIIDYKTVIDLKDSNEVDGSLIAEVQETKDGFKFKRNDQMKALELIGKHLGMFVDKVESKNLNENINTDLTNMTEEERKKRIAELLNK